MYNQWEVGIDRVNNRELASSLGYHPSTISINLQKIAGMEIEGKPLLYTKKYYGTQLTPFGLSIAFSIEQKYRRFEFLLAKLGFEFYEIAHELEKNKFTDNLIESMFNRSRNGKPHEPLYCPHGAIIRSEIPNRRFLYSMDQVTSGHSYEFVKFDEFLFSTITNKKEQRSLSKNLHKLQLKPSHTVVYTRKDHDEVTLENLTTSKRISLSAEVIKSIYVADQVN